MKKGLLTLVIATGALFIGACANTSADDSVNKTHDTLTSEVESSLENESTTVENSSSVVENPEIDSEWNVNFNQYGNAFRSTLESLISAKRTKTCSYQACLDLGAKAAAYPAGSSTFVPFYHDESTTTTTGLCNREHTWPNSRGSGKTGPGADPFIIRPTLTSENSSRQNFFYGDGSSSKEWDPKSCGFEAARGEAARVILYAATAYHTSYGFELSNNPNDSESLKTMGTLKTLLKWNAAYAPTTIEKQVNNYLYDNGYGRNPFVDHPEYANYIWNDSGVRESANDGQSTEDTSKDDTPSVKYNLVKSLEDIENVKIALVTAQTTSGPWMGMTTNSKTDALPWYITGVTATLSSDKTTMSCDSASLAWFNLEKQSDGKFKIHHETAGYLNNYVNDTHYSICFGTPTTYDSTTDLWTITMDSNGACVFQGDKVWLEYYKGSFCGYSKAPSVGIYLYAQA